MGSSYWEAQHLKERRRLERQCAMIKAELAEQSRLTLRLHATLRPFATAKLNGAAFVRAREVYEGGLDD